MTGERIWVQHIFDDYMTCLPIVIVQTDIECDLGSVTNKTVVIGDNSD